jgi:hypothetical protein
MQSARIVADAKNTMWCKICRQDVPAQPSADQQILCCPRCGAVLCADPDEASLRDRAAHSTAEQPSGASAAPTGLPWYDGWELDQQLRHIEHVLHGVKRKQHSPSTRIDRAHAAGPDWHVPVARPPEKRQKAGGRMTGSRLLMWFSIGLGTISSLYGGVLLGWSLATGRQDLWNTGLPLGLAGQIVLLAGLVLLIDRLWHDNRTTAERLENVGHELHKLQASTTLLETTQGPGAGAFYSHLASGAGPHLLLGDLKCQLDLLTARLAAERLAER